MLDISRTMKRITIALCLLIPSSCSVNAFSFTSSLVGNNRHAEKSFRRNNVVTQMSSTVKEKNEIHHVMSNRQDLDNTEEVVPMLSEPSTGMELEFLDSSMLQKSEPTTKFLQGLQDTNWFEPLAWRGVILILCALWGSNFAAAKLVMAEPGVDSSLYALARFTVAAAALLPGAVGAMKKADMDWETVKGGLICGSWVAFGYLGQTVGLLTTTASKSCVICSMHCVFVAALAEYWRVSNSDTDDTKYDTFLVPTFPFF